MSPLNQFIHVICTSHDMDALIMRFPVGPYHISFSKPPSVFKIEELCSCPSSQGDCMFFLPKKSKSGNLQNSSNTSFPTSCFGLESLYAVVVFQYMLAFCCAAHDHRSGE